MKGETMDRKSDARKGLCRPPSIAVLDFPLARGHKPAVHELRVVEESLIPMGMSSYSPFCYIENRSVRTRFLYDHGNLFAQRRRF